MKGRVELRDVLYRYSPSDPLVLEGVNPTVEQGKFVAITGPSGGGKSSD
jgi:ATP-binding cassette subfamily B protein RaxB